MPPNPKELVTPSWRQRLWIRLIPRNDLIIIHHALRLLSEHPRTKDLPEALAVEYLADRLWDESVRRKS